MPTIRAALCRAHGQPLTIEPVTLPDPGPGEVLVRLSACAICHSDITYADGAWGGALPAIYGHEAAGRVEVAGPGAVAQPGQAVLVTLIRSCGGCGSCAGGAPTYCESPGATAPATTETGELAARMMACGAFAEAVVVHESQIVPIPEGMAMDAASLLSCGVITGVGAVIHSGRVRPGESVVVIGAGGVGLNAIQGARIAGATRIIAVDMSEEKLAAAREFGATDGVLATEAKPWAAVRDLTGGRGADAVFVTVGAIPAYDTAPRYLAPRGRLVMVGMPASGAMSSYEPVVIAALGQAMVGSKMGDVVLKRDIPWLIDLYQQGRLKLDELITGRWSLDQINEAIADTRTGRARRNVILFDHAPSE